MIVMYERLTAVAGGWNGGDEGMVLELFSYEV